MFPSAIDLHQAGSGDLPVEQTIEIDQQIFRTRNAGGDVVIDEVGHAEGIDQAVAGGELDARLPFRRLTSSRMHRKSVS